MVRRWNVALQVAAVIGASTLIAGLGAPSAMAASGAWSLEAGARLAAGPAGALSSTEELMLDVTSPDVPSSEDVVPEEDTNGGDAAPAPEIPADADPLDASIPADAAEATAEEEGAVEAAPEPAPEVEAEMVPENSGITMPGQDEAVGDVLKLGYEQVVRLRGSRVEIVEPETRGSRVLHSFEAGSSDAWPPRDFHGSFQVKSVMGLKPSHVAVLGGMIYVSNVISKWDQDGKWGSELRKFDATGRQQSLRQFGPQYVVTALDAFRFKDVNYLAIGLNTTGVRIALADSVGMRDFRVVHGDWNGNCLGCYARDMVSVVKLGATTDGDRMMLAAGRFTYNGPAVVGSDLMVHLGDDTKLLGSAVAIWRNNERPAWIHDIQWPQAMGWGRFGPEDRSQLTITWPTIDTTSFLDLHSGRDWHWITGGKTSVVRYFTDMNGERRLALRRSGDSLIGGLDKSGNWTVVRSMKPEDLAFAVPGHRSWDVTIDNRTRSEVSVKPFTGASKATGCWLAGADFPHVANALPTHAFPVSAGQVAGPFATAQRFITEDCPKEHPGVFYLQVDSGGSTANRQLVQLHGDKDGIRVHDQVGNNTLKVSAERVPNTAYGVRVTVTEAHGDPMLQAGPSLTAKRLTPAPDNYRPSNPPSVDDPNLPVYRFNVSGATWRVPGANSGRAHASVPLPTAEGSVDGSTWTALGTTASPLAPKLTGDAVTMGAATFYWQTTHGGIDYRYFRVTLPGGSVSNVVDVQDRTAVPIPAPAPNALIQAMVATGAATPRPTGLDQAEIRVSLNRGKDTAALDPEEYREYYDRIYYRDSRSNLVTGLGNPADPWQIVMVSHEPGQYANDSGTLDSSASIPVFISTGSPTQDRQVNARMRPVGNGNALGASMTVKPKVDKLASDGFAADGLWVKGCAEGACALADPKVAPAMHSLDSAQVTLQFQTPAIHGGLSLPLTDPQHPAHELRLFSDPMKVAHGKSSVVQPNMFGTNATVSTHLITHGERVLADDHFVRAK